TSSNIQTIEPNNQDEEDQTIELNYQNNENPINHDFQTHIPLLNIQINSISPTDPGIYGSGNSYPNAFKKILTIES
ncbi:19108_t:CDS:2, partial [Racocetra fulgida]